MNIAQEISLKMYRVYGYDNERAYDEYCEATSAQVAVDHVREWHEGEPYQVLEVSKVVKGWK